MGIKVPILAGIMPIQNLGQLKRFVSMIGAKIPHPLLLKLERLESDPDAVAAAGIEYATRQCQDLLFHGAEGIHFYTLNKSKATVQICRELKIDHAS
jgi:methylenetetrahydrofolate reductase (NADPH)